MIISPNIGTGSKHSITILEDGLLFEDASNQKVYRWESIKHIFSWKSRNVLVVIDKSDCVILGNLFRDKYFNNITEMINSILSTWLINLPPESSSIRSFGYPDWCNKQNMNGIRSYIVNGFVSATIFGFITVEISDSFKEILTNWGSFGSALFSVLSICLMLYGLYKRFKYNPIHQVEIQDSTFLVTYESEQRSFPLHEVIYVIEKNTNTKIIFQNKDVLHGVNRVSYWPVLRDRLLSKLEPSN